MNIQISTSPIQLQTRLHLSIDCESRLLDFFTNFSWASLSIFYGRRIWSLFLFLWKRKIISEWSSLLTRNSNYPHPISEKLRGDGRQHNFEWYQQKKEDSRGREGVWQLIPLALIPRAPPDNKCFRIAHKKILNLIKERNIKRNINYLVGDAKFTKRKKLLQNYLIKITLRAISWIES